MCNKQSESEIEKKKYARRQTIDFRSKGVISMWWIYDNPNTIIKISAEQFNRFCDFDEIYIKYFFENMKKYNVDIHIELEDLIGVKMTNGKLYKPQEPKRKCIFKKK